MEIESHDQIDELYLKMKMIQPNARHIVCAYWIDGFEPISQAQDYHDDGEPMAGRQLLDILIKDNLKNRVIFVARRYGGIKMGPERFDCYKKAA